MTKRELLLTILTVISFCIMIGNDYNQSRDKKALTKQLQQADSIVNQQQMIIDVALLSDQKHSKNIDSIQLLINENDTIKFEPTDIDSIRAIWAREFSNQ